MADRADWAICLARTDPDAPRHDGIGCFLVDMATPGIDIRPLRELTGMAMFNEVFLTDVFVPDDCVVGGPTDGWECGPHDAGQRAGVDGVGLVVRPGRVGAVRPGRARAGCSTTRSSPTGSAGWWSTRTPSPCSACARRCGRSAAASPGPEASVRKLLGVEHEQDVQEAGLALLGPDAVDRRGRGCRRGSAGFLGNRALSIAGGTSEIQRNVIAERLLGLPKDG